MKKIIYSKYTKFLFVLLFIVSMVMSIIIGTNGLAKFEDEKVQVYGFERSFNEARFFNNMLQEPEQIIFNVYDRYYEEKNTSDVDEIKTFYKTGKLIVTPETEVDEEIVNKSIEIDSELINQSIEQEIDNLYYLDQIDYCINLNGKILSNCGVTNPMDLTNNEFYMLVTNEKGNVERLSNSHRYYYSPLLENDYYKIIDQSLTIATSVKPTIVNECRELWEKQREMVYQTIGSIFVFLLLGIISYIYLIIVCGKDKNGEIKTLFIDKVWIEIQVILLFAITFGGGAAWFVLMDEYFSGHFELDFINNCVAVISAIVSATVLFFTLSIFRNIKAKKFLERSIIFRIISWLWRIFVRVIKWIYRKTRDVLKTLFSALYLKTGIIIIGLLLIYTALVGICGILVPEGGFALIMGILFFCFASYLVARRSNELDKIKKGAKEIREGNLSYKIPEMKSEDMKIFATDINEIGKGLDESVAEKLKAERLKTELITNVSHDIKTPLTSIISYTELLSNVPDLPEEAKDYAKIIANKSERLKVLTQDLFEISKVQSGNDNVVLEKLDISLLIEQSLAEHDNEIKKSQIPFCVNLSKELYIMADGRKMSRVISNLVSNILKYSMKNTRAFISAFEKGNEIVVEFKNISAYPMEFDVNEIMGRFVRGDKSRTSEGNGLGLAIVKSFVEVCDGKFDIVVDGDLFKAIITFKKLN